MLNSRLKLAGTSSSTSYKNGIEFECFSSKRKNGLLENRFRTEFIFRKWLEELDDEEKNVLIYELMSKCCPTQIQLLSTLLEPRLPQFRFPDYQDPFFSLPAHVILKIFTFLDPVKVKVTLVNCAHVCRLWRRYYSEPFLWKSLCNAPTLYRLSSKKAEIKQLDKHTDDFGNVRWKDAFSERYRLWKNWQEGRCVVRTFQGHSQGIFCVQFDGSRIISGSSDNTIRMWDTSMQSGQNMGTITLTGHSATVRCLRLDGNRLASGSNDFSIKLWDLNVNPTWSSIACRQTMVGHDSFVRCLQMDSRKILSGSYDRAIKVWDVETGQCLMTLNGHNDAVLCLQYDENKVMSGSADNSIKSWDVRCGLCTLSMINAHQDAVTCLHFDHDRLVSGSLDRTIKLWDVQTGRWLRTLDWMKAEGHTGVVRYLQADSWRIVSAADDRTLKVWNLHTGQRISTLRNHSDGVTCLQFNDLQIVSGSYDKTVKLWDFSIS